MKSRFSPAFALPTILISSVVMLIVLLLAIQSTISVSEGIRGQYADKLGSEAAESGVALAKACIAQNGTITWTNTLPLKPNTSCTGAELFSCPITSNNPACYLLDEGLYQSTFTVGVIYDAGNNPTDINAQGIVREVRKTNGAVIKQNAQTQVLNLALIGGVSQATTEGLIDAGTNHVCQIITTYAHCWGSGVSGQIGDGFSTNRFVPVLVNRTGVLASKTILKIGAGTSHSCAIASDNNAYCWGVGANGQLGQGSTYSSNVPVAVTNTGVLAGKTLKSITAGYIHTCAIASDSNAYCWGGGGNGQLGNNNTVETSVPVAVTTTGVLAGKTIKSIAAGEYHTCVIASDNNAYCWGYNGDGALGNGTSTQSAVPVAVTTTGVLAGKTLKSITAGARFTCAIASDNNAYCWGAGSNGQLGYSSSGTSYSPVAVTNTGVLAGKTIKAINAGSYHTCAIASDNNAYCWGYNAYGQLGNGGTTGSNSPVTVTASGVLAGKILTSVAAGDNYSCSLDDSNKAYCWGQGNSGQLGNNSSSSSYVPVVVSNP